MNISKVKVNEVKQAPQLNNLDTLSGIRDKDATRVWGEKNGYAVVYFVASKQRVYADRLQTRVDEQSRVIEQASGVLLVTAETIKRTIAKVESL